jgi:two-component system LytT family response regulator
MTIRAVIVDDEAVARRRIRRLLAGEKDIEVIGECSNGPQAVSLIETERPDLLFLDVEMPEMDGFELLMQLDRTVLPVIIFATAFDKYAVRAFESHALDYLLKPIDSERLQSALDRARSHLHREKGADANREILAMLSELQKQRGRLERIMVKKPGRAFFVKLASVDRFEAADNYIRVHAGPDTHLIRETMSALEARLDPNKFVRVHRSTIVNVDRIKEIHSLFQGRQVIVLHNGDKVTLGRNYRERLDRLLGNT